MRLRSFARSSFGLAALGVNFSYFFRLRMASPCASIVALCPILAVGRREVENRLIGPLGPMRLGVYS